MFLNADDIDDKGEGSNVQQEEEQTKSEQKKRPQRIQNNRFQLKKTDDSQQQATKPQRDLTQAVKKQDQPPPEPIQQEPMKSSVLQRVEEIESKSQLSQSQLQQKQSTYQQRQKLLEQQKQLLQQKHQQQIQGGVTLNNKQQNDEIDYAKLALIVNNSSQYQHEPGQFNDDHDNLPQLKAMDNRINLNKDQLNQPPKELFQSTKVDNPILEEENHEKPLLEQQDISESIIMRDEDNQSEQSDSSLDEKINEESENNLIEQQKEDEMRKELKQQNEKIQIAEPPSSENQSLNTSPTKAVEQVEQTEEKKEEDQQKPVVQPPAQPIKKQPYTKPFDNIVTTDMKNFLCSPCQQGGMVQCTIKRDKSGMGRFYPKYHIHLSNGFKYLMTAKKRACNNTSNYLVSMSRNDLDKKSQHFLGKVRSNFLGTEFTLYDKGENPKKKLKQGEFARAELGMVFYESNILGTKGPRKMKVLIPKIDEKGNAEQFIPKNSKEGLLADYRKNQTSKMIVMINRPPKWNDQVQAFVLNFYGRVDRPSVKNFQLVEENGEDLILLQFGRVGEDLFNLDFTYPFSPLQAFQIALSSFDYKIACE